MRRINIDRLCEFAYACRESGDARRLRRCGLRLKAQSHRVTRIDHLQRWELQRLSRACILLARATFRRREFHADGRTVGYGRTQEIEREAHALIASVANNRNTWGI